MRYMKVSNNLGTINVNGDWSLLESHDIEEEIGEAYGNGVTRYIVDFSGTEDIDYASIQFLLELKMRVGDGKMAICNVHPSGLVAHKLQGSSLAPLIQ